ncbi:uncharacterized protein LOC128325405 [Hemicordylus capensis]|uniref:uncharacterized protein LOC128325405 n=1 Tax=Hemicordylus capensis TaxID=884348 RepID=UPI0023042B61|nr:uncharacterized protein LOC128325405 [Hemicordylus capensis]
MGGCWSWVNCRSHSEAEPKNEDEDEEGAQTGHPRNPAHVAPSPGGPTLHHILGDPRREEPNEATLVPGPLPGLHFPTDILGKELNKEASKLGSLPEPHVPTDILEEELNDETSVPGSLPGPCINNGVLGEETNEATLVPGSLPILCVPADILGKEVNEDTSKPGPLPGPHIINGILGEELNEATSVPGSLSGPLISINILEETLKEETSMPGSLPGPHITNDIRGEEVNEETSVPGPSIPTGTPKEEAFVSEPLPEPSTADNDLEEEVEILTGLQNDYVQRQMRVRRISQEFPRSLRAINLQIGHARTRLIRSEVRLQRWGKEGDQALMPVIQTASHDVPEGPAACLRPPGSGSSLSSALLEVGSIPPSTSTSSFLLHPSPPPPPSPPPLEPDLSNVRETLQSLMDMQFHHLNDRQRDLRSCQECVQNLKALRGQLRRLRSRLARVEATMGILVPPRELDVEEEKEKDQNQQ